VGLRQNVGATAIGNARRRISTVTLRVVASLNGFIAKKDNRVSQDAPHKRHFRSSYIWREWSPGFWLEWAISPSYSACMRSIWLLLCLIVLAFCGVAYAAYLSWRKMSVGKRIMGVLMLSPHFLLVVCIVVSLLCGHPPQGSRCFNTQFLCSVLLVFFLPLPALVGTLAALIMFKRARMVL
jgi:hypothetical protein